MLYDRDMNRWEACTVTYENNVIELKQYRTAGFDYEGYSCRAERRLRAKLRRERLLTAVELAVSCAIGVGFTACVLLFFTML